MKKIIITLITILVIFGSYTIVRANPNNLDNRGETEGTAGITWDQINEMSTNSPNSLTPMQGLMLWMFAIIAFLKLAQKMDSLLQSLGLNVTQTGGRAIGDMVMAGMAIKNIGGAFSKGMGMFGFGGKGGGASGGSSSSSGTNNNAGGTTNAGGGPKPIPSGNPGGNQSQNNNQSNIQPSSNQSAPNSANNSSGTTPNTKNPVGKFANWMKQNGTAQGVIRAGAKGGVIGLGYHGIKGAANKLGLSSSSVAVASSDSTADINPDNQASANVNNDTNNPVINTNENSEQFQDSRPRDESDLQTPIISDTNNEEYNIVADSFNNSKAATMPINGTEGHATELNENESDVNGVHANNEALSTPIAANGDNASAAVFDTSKNEKWHNSNEDGGSNVVSTHSGQNLTPQSAKPTPNDSSQKVTAVSGATQQQQNETGEKIATQNRQPAVTSYYENKNTAQVKGTMNHGSSRDSNEPMKVDVGSSGYAPTVKPVHSETNEAIAHAKKIDSAQSAQVQVVASEPANGTSTEAIPYSEGTQPAHPITQTQKQHDNNVSQVRNTTNTTSTQAEITSRPTVKAESTTPVVRAGKKK